MGCRYKFQCYLHMKTLSLRLDTIRGVRVAGKKLALEHSHVEMEAR